MWHIKTYTIKFKEQQRLKNKHTKGSQIANKISVSILSDLNMKAAGMTSALELDSPLQ